MVKLQYGIFFHLIFTWNFAVTTLGFAHVTLEMTVSVSCGPPLHSILKQHSWIFTGRINTTVYLGLTFRFRINAYYYYASELILTTSSDHFIFICPTQYFMTKYLQNCDINPISLGSTLCFVVKTMLTC